MTSVLLIITIWCFLFIVYTGFGIFTRALFGLHTHRLSPSDYIRSAWIGWAASIFLLQVWHLFAPVNEAAFFTFSAAGIIFSGYYFLKDPSSLKRAVALSPAPLICFVLIALWTANHAVGPPRNYDSGLYHLNAVRWLDSYAIVPGLANLHGRLAFSHSYFLYAAFLENDAWPCRSYHLANGFLFMLFYLQATPALLKALSPREKLRPSEAFRAMTFFPCFYTTNLSSPSTDLPVFFLSMLLTAELLSTLENAHARDEKIPEKILTIIILAALGLTLKLNFIVMALTALLVVFLFNLYYKNPGQMKRKFYMKLSTLFVLFTAVWILRSVILTGYPAYPLPWGSFPVDWRLPEASAINMLNWTTAWNRTPWIVHWSESLHGWDWLGPWAARLANNTFGFFIPMLLTSTGLIVLLCLYRYRKDGSSFPFLFCCFMPPVLSLFYWFFASPEPRLAVPFFWALALTALAVNFAITAKSPVKLLIVLPFILLLKVSNPFIVVNESVKAGVIRHSVFFGLHYFLQKSELINFSDKPFHFGLPPKVSTKPFKTDWGLILYTLEKGDQAWDPPLPFTLYPHPKLRLRKHNIQSGFKIDPLDEDDASVGLHEEWFAER